jgi:ankyrin repeat protein
MVCVTYVGCSSGSKDIKRTTFGDACVSGDYAQARQSLQDGVDPNGKFKLFPTDNDSTTPLMAAVGFAHPKIVNLLLLNGANPNINGSKADENPLMTAVIECEENANPQIRKMSDLIRFGDSSGDTRERVYSEIISSLLKAGASPNVIDRQGSTPLHRAAQFCDLTTVQLLLQYGADPNAKNRYGKAPMDLVDDSCKSIHELLVNAHSKK